MAVASQEQNFIEVLYTYPSEIKFNAFTRFIRDGSSEKDFSRGRQGVLNRADTRRVGTDEVMPFIRLPEANWNEDGAVLALFTWRLRLRHNQFFALILYVGKHSTQAPFRIVVG